MTNLISKQLKEFKQICTSALLQFPIELILGVLFFLFYFIADQEYLSEEVTENVKMLLLFYPILSFITSWLHQITSKKQHWIYYLTPLLVIPLFYIDCADWLNSWRYPILLLFSMILFLYGYTQAKENKRFTQQTFHIAINLLMATFIGQLLFVLWTTIFYSIGYIFEFPLLAEYTLPYLLAAIYFIFIPLYFYGLTNRVKEEKMTPLSNTYTRIINYIFSIALLTYTAILYLYFAKIVFLWELPKGGVSYMVIFFVTFLMIGKHYQQIVSKPFFGGFYRSSSLLALLPLSLFWVGTIYRIGEYGFTENRLYLVLIGALITCYTLLVLFKPQLKTAYYLLFSSIVLLLFTFIPGLSTKDIGIYSQQQRLEQKATQLNLFTKDKKLKAFTNTQDSVEYKIALELQSSYDYLKDEYGKESMVEKYGDINIQQKSSMNLYITQKKESDISDYTTYYPIGGTDLKFSYKNGIIKVE
ncbi:MAG: DUF4153 domain-containing protein, partial [Bacteroidaceae bacterium]|nr:DUF4153 domain-containing protein [Bacteroidaceae bacterium]